MTFTSALFSIVIQASQNNTYADNPLRFNPRVSLDFPFTQGEGDDQADSIAFLSGTVTSSALSNIDLGTMEIPATNGVSGVVDISVCKLWMLVNKSATNLLLMQVVSSNGFQGGNNPWGGAFGAGLTVAGTTYGTVPPKGMVVYGTPKEGMNIEAGSYNLGLRAGSGTVDYEIWALVA